MLAHISTQNHVNSKWISRIETPNSVQDMNSPVPMPGLAQKGFTNISTSNGIFAWGQVPSNIRHLFLQSKTKQNRKLPGPFKFLKKPIISTYLKRDQKVLRRRSDRRESCDLWFEVQLDLGYIIDILSSVFLREASFSLSLQSFCLHMWYSNPSCNYNLQFRS